MPLFPKTSDGMYPGICRIEQAKMRSRDQSKLALLQMQTIHSSIHITGTDFFQF